MTTEPTRTLNVQLNATVDGFAAHLLDSIADDLDAAAEGCRVQADAIRDRQGTVHATPGPDGTVTKCCQRAPDDLPDGDRLTGNRALVTCSEPTDVG